MTDIKNLTIRVLKSVRLNPYLLVFLMGFLAFTPFITTFGFYRDDWHVIWSGISRGANSIIDLHLVDRPFMGVVYAAVFKLLGGARIGWQIYIVILRICGGLGFLWLLRLIWPKRVLETASMAALYVIYPGFLQLPQASSYQVHLLAVLCGTLSLAFTIKGCRSSGFRIAIWFLGSAVLSTTCYLIMEWMIGLEIIRPVLIYWQVRQDEKMDRWRQIRKTFLYWLPNLIPFFVFILWRFFFFKSARAATDLGSLKGLYLSQPLQTLSKNSIELINGAINSIFLAYGVPAYQLTLSLSTMDVITGSVFALLGAGIFSLFWVNRGEPSHESVNSWRKNVAILGVLIVLATLLPVVMANRTVSFQDTFDRYTLLPMAGVVMILWALIDPLERKTQATILITLIFISFLTHYGNTQYFKEFWETQRQLWWQLTWRAPDLEEGTTLVANLPSPFQFSEGYEVWGPANLIYRPDTGKVGIPAEIINMETLPRMLKSERYGKTFRRVDFTLDFGNILLLSLPSRQSCLHVIDANRGEISENENAAIRLLAQLSNENRIIDKENGVTPQPAIFGKEPEHGWCYYYQRASLARQRKDWEEVVRLGDLAAEKGFTPSDTSELMPFYEGYAQLGKIDRANEIGSLIRTDENFISLYCLFRKSQLPPSGKTEEYILYNICGKN
jgi:hypothetical protein